jgi:hypothetical protein
MMCSDFVLDCVMFAGAAMGCRLAMMADDRCVGDVDGWESDARFAVGVVAIVAVGAGIRRARVPARDRSALCHLK